jgi:hypothetical protein
MEYLSEISSGFWERYRSRGRLFAECAMGEGRRKCKSDKGRRKKLTLEKSSRRFFYTQNVSYKKNI